MLRRLLGRSTEPSSMLAELPEGELEAMIARLGQELSERLK
jgi:hypothetical protein